MFVLGCFAVYQISFSHNSMVEQVLKPAVVFKMRLKSDYHTDIQCQYSSRLIKHSGGNFSPLFGTSRGALASFILELDLYIFFIVIYIRTFLWLVHIRVFLGLMVSDV